MNALGSVCSGEGIRLDAPRHLLAGGAKDCKFMNQSSVAASAWAAHIPTRARIAATRVLAATVTAGFILGGISFAGTASANAAAVASKPAPRAFFGLGPATKGKIDGRPYFLWDASPGSYLSDEVALVNFGAIPVTLTIFVTNAVPAPHGGTAFLNQGKAHGSLAAWVKLHMPHGSATILLAPDSKVFVPVTAVFPKNAQPGDHVGAIVASLTSVIQSKNHAKVHLVQQVADRIILRVSGRLQPRLSVTNMRVAYNDPLNPAATAPATLSFNIVNSGNEVLGGKISVAVSGLLGSAKTKPDIVSIPAMLPGGSDGARVVVDGVYPGFLETGKVNIQPLVPTGQFDKGLGTFSGQVSFWAVPWIPLIVVILIVLLPFGLWYRRRRRRRAGSAVSAGQRSAVISGGTA
jgi:hypothetical protein